MFSAVAPLRMNGAPLAKKTPGIHRMIPGFDASGLLEDAMQCWRMVFG
jgi:hypothetical protein